MIKIYILLINNEFLKSIILKLIIIINYLYNRSFIANINKILYKSELNRKFNLFYLIRIKQKDFCEKHRIFDIN